MSSSNNEQRREIRRKVYFGEGLKVTIKDINEVNTFMGEAADISPWGIAFIIHDHQLSTYPKVGDDVRVYYSNKDKMLGSVQARVLNLVRFHRRGEDFLRYGLQFINENILDGLGKEERKVYYLEDLFMPHAWCNDSFFFQEKILFRIKGLNAEGMRLLTSARNKSFLPNLLVTMRVYLPIQGEFEVVVRILSTETPSDEESKNRYIVIVQFTNPNPIFLQAVSEYILFCGVDVTPQELRREKLPMAAIEKSLSFYYATIQNDMDIIKHLRETSMFDDNGVINSDGTEVKEQELSGNFNFGFDVFDQFSRQIICKMGKKPIACVRLIFNNKDRKKCEMSTFVQSLPEWLWTRRFVEISRLAWEKEYRESDVFINLVRNIIRITVESGHTHILTSSPPALKNLYLKVGFQPLQLSWKLDLDVSKLKETPLLLDAKNILKGDLIIDKLVWAKIYGPVAKHLGMLK